MYDYPSVRRPEILSHRPMTVGTKAEAAGPLRRPPWGGGRRVPLQGPQGQLWDFSVRVRLVGGIGEVRGKQTKEGQLPG